MENWKDINNGEKTNKHNKFGMEIDFWPPTKASKPVLDGEVVHAVPVWESGTFSTGPAAPKNPSDAPGYCV